MMAGKGPTVAGFRLVARSLSWTAVSLIGQFLGLVRWHRAAVWVFGRAADARPDQRAVFVAERGMSYARLKRRDDAIRDVHEAIRLAPDNPYFLLYMAWVHEELSSPGEAITFYERAANSPSSEFSESMRQSIRSRVDAMRHK